MSQTWSLPLVGSTDTMSVSDTKLNDGFDTLRTHWLGASDPSSLVDGMIWAQTTAGKLRMRAGSATYDIGDWGVADLGHIRKDGTIAFTGNIDAGSNRITNLAAASGANDGIRKTEFDAKYHATTGHSHNGTTGNGPNIAASNLTGLPYITILGGSDQAQIDLQSTGVSWTAYDITSDITPSVARTAYLRIFCEANIAVSTTLDIDFKFRATGESLAQIEEYFLHENTDASNVKSIRFSRHCWVPLNSAESFDYQVTLTSGTVSFWQILLVGFETKVV